MSEARTLREFNSDFEFENLRQSAFFVMETDKDVSDFMDETMLEVARRLPLQIENKSTLVNFETVFHTLANYGCLYDYKRQGTQKMIEVTLGLLKSEHLAILL